MLSKILALGNRAYAVLNTASAPRKSLAANSLRPDCISALASSLSVDAGGDDGAGRAGAGGCAGWGDGAGWVDGAGRAGGVGCGAATAVPAPSTHITTTGQRGLRITQHCRTSDGRGHGGSVCTAARATAPSRSSHPAGAHDECPSCSRTAYAARTDG